MTATSTFAKGTSAKGTSAASAVPVQREQYPAAVPGLRFAAARPGLWRVAATDGTLLGHIERVAAEDGERFTARRVRPGALAVELGRFWSSRDAAEVFR